MQISMQFLHGNKINSLNFNRFFLYKITCFLSEIRIANNFHDSLHIFNPTNFSYFPIFFSLTNIYFELEKPTIFLAFYFLKDHTEFFHPFSSFFTFSSVCREFFSPVFLSVNRSNTKNYEEISRWNSQFFFLVYNSHSLSVFCMFLSLCYTCMSFFCWL